MAVVVGAHLDVVQDARELLGRRHERAVDGRQALELAQSRAQRARHARVQRLGPGQDPRLTAVGSGEERRALGGQAPAQRGRVRGRRGHAIDLVQEEVGVVGLPQRARLRRRRLSLDAGALLEAVGQVGPRELARGAQPGEQVVGAAGRQRTAQQRDEAAPQRGVTGRDGAVERVRDLELAEDLLEQRRMLARLAQDDRDVLGREGALADQPRDVRGDELDLRALPAALE
jgi:hypothetical protein